ncbi:MAG: LytTR family DNA-binding domain-containing protein [Gammaproteobacteria bacterium]
MEIIRQLPGDPFARSHRSFIVNVDKIAEIRSVDGKSRILLTGGQEIPLSRGYRDEFNARIAGRPA